MNRREFNRLTLGAAAAAALTPIASYAASAYTPKFARVWAEVQSFIQAEWMKDVVRSDEFPTEFIQSSPGWKFMFYWDNYFINLGLLRLKGYERLARNSATNLLSLVDRYGFVPNCSLSWGRNRSQPPYLSSMVRESYGSSEAKDKTWLRKAYETLRKEYRFWMDDFESPIERHSTSIPGLQRYSHHATVDDCIEFYKSVLVARFRYPADASKEEQIKAVQPYITEAATGMDFTPRFEHRCPDFAALDLNVLLYVYEINFDYFARELGLAGQPDWLRAAAERKALIQKYCWDEKRGLFMDYDFVNHRTSQVPCCTAYMPMWAGIASNRQNARMRQNLSVFECDWGLATCPKTEQKFKYQWDFPNGWVPLHALVIGALSRGGFRDDAVRIASKYLDLVARNFNKPSPSTYTSEGKTVTRVPGRLYEKYNVVSGEIADTEYTAFEGLGWTAGVFIFAHDIVHRG